MQYEIVELEEKIVVGLKARTSNSSIDMSAKIGQLWENFFVEKVYFSIPNKINDKSIGLYTNYSGQEKEEYDVYVCCEVEKELENLSNVSFTHISKGKYAKFIIKGNVKTAVQEFWEKLSNISLNRKFDCDFEEYQANGTMENSEIHIYLSIN